MAQEDAQQRAPKRLRNPKPMPPSGAMAAELPENDISEPEKHVPLHQRERKAHEKHRVATVAAATTKASNATSSENTKPVAAMKTLKTLQQNRTVSKPAAPKPANRKKAPFKAAASKTAWMLKETGELMSTIEPKSVQPNYAVVSSEPGFKTLCSYNWQDDGSIFVPGGPPKWTPPILPVRLPQDTGQQFIDQNAYRVPRYPFEPAFQAMAIMNPSVRLNDVDIIANRNSLRKLLDFAAGKGQDPFCMGLHMINDTLVISRKERCARHMIHGAANSGYGHNFEKAFTAPDEGMDNSSSHHRVIRYHIGSMDCVVRFEVDAYYEDPDDTDMAQLTSDPVGALTSSMTDLAVTNQSSTAPTPKGATKAVRKGNFIHPSKLAEIKARKAERLNDAMPQLWFGRTPYFMVGKHNNGVVNSVSITHAASIFAAWEKENDDRLRKLVSVLAELKSIVKGTAKGAAILVYEKGGGLKAFEMKKDTGVLPKDIIGRHWDVAGDVKLK